MASCNVGPIIENPATWVRLLPREVERKTLLAHAVYRELLYSILISVHADILESLGLIGVIPTPCFTRKQ